MNKFKKISLLFGTTVSIVAPLATVISCGDDKPKTLSPKAIVGLNKKGVKSVYGRGDKSGRSYTLAQIAARDATAVNPADRAAALKAVP